MGLSESKEPFEEASGPKTPKNAKEIGICPMWDPRSPSADFDRTPPVFYRDDKVEIRDENIGSVIEDPRSPSNGITRTPVGVEYQNSATDNVYSELRVQLERLQIFDGGTHNTTASSENLGNDSESIVAVAQQKTVLKLLDDESSPNNVDSLWLPNTPPCPKSRSTPRELTPSSPQTPESRKKETDVLIKRRRPSSKKQQSSQKHEKLQKKVLKKALTEQVTRSPLAERNVMAVKETKQSTGKTKSAAFLKYRKYNSLDESFNDSFIGKENEHIVW